MVPGAVREVQKTVFQGGPFFAAREQGKETKEKTKVKEGEGQKRISILWVYSKIAIFCKLKKFIFSADFFNGKKQKFRSYVKVQKTRKRMDCFFR